MFGMLRGRRRPVCRICRNQKETSRRRASWRSKLNHAVTSAKGRHECTIDGDYLIDLLVAQGGKCALSGQTMTRGVNDPHSVSIDRIDCAKGYIPGNVRLVCKVVNIMRMTMSDEDLRKWARHLADK